MPLEKGRRLRKIRHVAIDRFLKHIRIAKIRANQATTNVLVSKFLTDFPRDILLDFADVLQFAV